LSNDAADSSAAAAKPAADDREAADRRRLAVAKIMLDYHADAIVNDPLFGKPLVGKLAIATHKTAEMIALSDVDLKVTDRWVIGGELTAIWEVTGIHSGPYYNLPATGRRISISGATVVTRRDGKIAQETLYYDADDMLRQLSAEATEPLDLPEPSEMASRVDPELDLSEPPEDAEPSEDVEPSDQTAPSHAHQAAQE
jgi:steroid delta-isomerase-like uncharacterized protein